MEILRVLPPMVTPVALFVNAEPQRVRQVAVELGIRTVQLHGDEPPESLAELKNLTVIKAVRCDPKNLASVLETWREAAARWNNLSALLLETANTTAPGGSGVENDWAGIEAILKSQAALPPLIAAGGLTPENVATVIKRLRPYAVDVSSGIEQSRGIKSVDKMRWFEAEVRNADDVA